MNNKSTLLLLSFLIAQMSFAQKWHFDLEEAKEVAAKENKAIILVFQGSDWCRPCVMLKEEIFKTDTFKNYANDHFVLVEADFPQKPENALPLEQQEKNRQLGLTYNPKGIFPFVVVMDHMGKVLGETGYFQSSPSEYILHLQSYIN